MDGVSDRQLRMDRSMKSAATTSSSVYDAIRK